MSVLLSYLRREGVDPGINVVRLTGHCNAPLSGTIILTALKSNWDQVFDFCAVRGISDHRSLLLLLIFQNISGLTFLQIASNVDSRIAFALPFFNTEI